MNLTTTPTKPSSGSVVSSERLITVGEEVKDRYVGQPIHYDLTAPNAGTLVARLSWNPSWTEHA